MPAILVMTKTDNGYLRSPLADDSGLYSIPTAKTGHIIDNPEEGILKLYPAAYTKVAADTGYSRQATYRFLWELSLALHCETPDQKYPFGFHGHNVKIVHESKNQWDPNALKLILEVSTGDKMLPVDLNGADLGYVPKKINRKLLKNLSMINSGKIYRIRQNFLQKYWIAKIIFGYNNTTFTGLSRTEYLRYRGLLEDED